MQIRAYEVCSNWKVTLNKEDFKTEEYRQEKYNKWLTELKSNYKVHKIIVIDDDGVETVVKGGE